MKVIHQCRYEKGKYQNLLDIKRLVVIWYLTSRWTLLTRQGLLLGGHKTETPALVMYLSVLQ